MDADIYAALSDGNSYQFKQCSEELFAIRQKLKSVLDAGVSQEDFQKCQALYEAAEAASEIVDQLAERSN